MKKERVFGGILPRTLLPLFGLVAVSCSGDGGDPAGPSTPAVVAPQITAEPQDATVDEGAPVTFTVAATGTAPLSYQWERDGTAISGGTGTSYTIQTVAAADSLARFTVRVTNEAGSAESGQARVRVRTAPAITAQPASQSMLSGVPALFFVSATGSDLEYQWHRDGAAIPGATNPAYGVGVPLAGDDGAVYHVVVSNALGSVSSEEATLHVPLDPAVRPTSYANAKAMNQEPPEVPEGMKWWTARAYGDFFGNGNRDLVVADAVYDWDRPQSEATPGEFKFWRWTAGGYVLDYSLLDDATGCIHPRVAAVAKMNGDGQPDIFMGCHGYDRPPYPGEQSYLLLSQPDGTYAKVPVGDADDFYHAVTLMDVDGNGHVDIVVGDHWSEEKVHVFLNDGAGSLQKRTDMFTPFAGNVFTVQAADVDGDGRTDVLAAGHEWEGSETVVLLNDGSGSFANVEPVVLPTVENEGVVLDFAVFDADRDGVNEIYLSRSSGGDGTFYQSRVVQRVLWPALASTILLKERGSQPAYFIDPLFSDGGYSLILDVVDEPGPNPKLRLP